MKVDVFSRAVLFLIVAVATPACAWGQAVNPSPRLSDESQPRRIICMNSISAEAVKHFQERSVPPGLLECANESLNSKKLERQQRLSRAEVLRSAPRGKVQLTEAEKLNCERQRQKAAFKTSSMQMVAFNWFDPYEDEPFRAYP